MEQAIFRDAVRRLTVGRTAGKSGAIEYRREDGILGISCLVFETKGGNAA